MVAYGSGNDLLLDRGLNGFELPMNLCLCPQQGGRVDSLAYPLLPQVTQFLKRDAVLNVEYQRAGFEPGTIVHRCVHVRGKLALGDTITVTSMNPQLILDHFQAGFGPIESHGRPRPVGGR